MRGLPLLTFMCAVGLWWEPEPFLELAIEVLWGPETQAGCNLNRGHIAVQQKLAGLGETSAHDLFHHRSADGILEVTFETAAPKAAETSDIINYAKDKLSRKKLDMIIANDVSDQSIGFNSDENAVTVLWHDGEQALERAGKNSIARQVVALIAQRSRDKA